MLPHLSFFKKNDSVRNETIQDDHSWILKWQMQHLNRNSGKKFRLWTILPTLMSDKLLQIFGGVAVLQSLLLYHCQQGKRHEWIISPISSSGFLMRTATILEKESGGKCCTSSSQNFQNHFNAFLNSIYKLVLTHLRMFLYIMVKMEASKYWYKH